MTTTRVHSNQAFLLNQSNAVSTSNNALVDAGAGVFADALSLTAATAANGLFYFDVNEATGLELHFAMTGALASTGTARVMRVIPIRAGENTRQAQFTFRHLCDLSLVASSQTGVASGVTVAAQRWASATVSSDAGLTPLGTRTLNGLTTTAAGSVVIDPMCAGQIVVQVKIGTCTDIVVYPSNWTRN